MDTLSQFYKHTRDLVGNLWVKCSPCLRLLHQLQVHHEDQGRPEGTQTVKNVSNCGGSTRTLSGKSPWEFSVPVNVQKAFQRTLNNISNFSKTEVDGYPTPRLLPVASRNNCIVFLDAPTISNRGSVKRRSNIRALQGVHGVHHHRALRVLLSCPPHQRGREVPEFQRVPGKKKRRGRLQEYIHPKKTKIK